MIFYFMKIQYNIRQNKRKNRFRCFFIFIYNINIYIFCIVYNCYSNIIKLVIDKIFYLIKPKTQNFHFVLLIHNIQSLINIVFMRQACFYYSQCYFSFFLSFFHLYDLIFYYISIINNSFFIFKKIFNY